MWDFPGPGIKPVSPALGSGFISTVPPGTSKLEGFLMGKSKEAGMKLGLVTLMWHFLDVVLGVKMSLVYNSLWLGDLLAYPVLKKQLEFLH